MKIIENSRALLCSILLVTSFCHAAVLTWDPGHNTTGSDGIGTWSTGATVTNWANGTSDQAWANGSDAVIGVGGTGAIISLKSAVTVGNVTFNGGAGYSVSQGSSGNNLTLNGPTVTVNANATFSCIINGTGWTQEGTGTLTLAGSTSYPDGYSGLVTVDTGTLLLSKSKITGNGGVSIPGSLTINSNGTVRLGNTDQMVTAANINSAIVTVNGLLDTTNQSDTIGAIAGGGSITIGTGTLTLGSAVNASSFSGVVSGGGTLVVAAGTLAMTGGGVLSNATINVASGATLDVTAAAGATLTLTNQTLKGNGTVTGAVIVGDGATLAPGNSAIGAINFSSTLALTTAGTNVMEINKGTATNDLATAVTSITYGGTLVINQVDTNLMIGGEVYKLFSAPSYLGTFANIVYPPLPSGLTWTNTLSSNGSIEVAGSIVIPPPAGSIVITNVTVSGTSFIISGTSDPTNANTGFTVYGTANLTTPLASWSNIGPGTFDANANFSVAVPYNSAAPANFFIIHSP